MAFNWRYYQETGAVGGTTALQYVDSFNGDDANSGAYNAPKQSIQGALDAGANGMTMVLAGYFNEGDYLNTKSSAAIQVEGYVLIDGSGFDIGNISTLYMDLNTMELGILHIKDYFDKIGTGDAYVATSSFKSCVFENLAITIIRGFVEFSKNVFINSQVTSNANSPAPVLTEDNTFINSSYSMRNVGALRNNYFDENSVLDVISGPGYLNHNFYKGTAGDGQKIRVDGFWYNNVEALQAATAYEADSLPSTTDPLLNPDGLSISELSPLRNAGWDKRAIGRFQMAHSTEADTVGVWTLVSLVEDAGKFKLAVAATAGTATSSLIEVFSRVRTILSINLPDFVINPYTGETIGRLASARTPYTVSVEIQYSTNGATTNGTWLRVPIGTQPMHDTVNNVGNDDPLFDAANATIIEASHLLYRVTLRNNETPLT